MMYQILFFIVIFLSNVIQAITGFAGTMIAMPPGILLVGMNEAKMILCVMGLLSCLVITVQNRQQIQPAEFRKISIWMSVGMILGLLMVQWVQPAFLLQGYAVLIILVALSKLFIRKSFSLSPLAGLGVLLSAGVVHGMFVSGGALLVIYASSVFQKKEEFRATLSLVWVFLNLFLLVNYILSGFLTGSVALLTVISILPLCLGIYVGNLLHHRISQVLFLRISSVLLLLSGVLLAVQSFS